MSVTGETDMQGTMNIDDLGGDVFAALTTTAGPDLVEPDVVSPPPEDAERDAFEPGTVMLSTDDRHRQLEIVARRLVEVAQARRHHP
jgi:hypothetical protein